MNEMAQQTDCAKVHIIIAAIIDIKPDYNDVAS